MSSNIVIESVPIVQVTVARGAEKQITLTSVGERGPKGDKGDVELLPEQVAGILAELELRSLMVLPTNVPLLAYRLVAVDSTGFLMYCTAGESSHVNRVLGMALTASDGSEPVYVQPFGEIQNPAWNFPIGASLYVGMDGQLSLTPTGTFHQSVGKVIKSDTILLQPSLGILRAI